MLLMTASAANAGGIVSKHASSVQLTVDTARSTATRVGHGMSISGSGVSTTDGTTAGVVGNSVLMTSDGFTGSASVVTASQATSGEAFSFSASYLQGDAVPTSAATVGDIPNFGSVTSYTAGTAGSLAGSIGTDGAISVTAGGAGSTAVGQFVSEITVID
jgi:hypothetical protein